MSTLKDVANSPVGVKDANLSSIEEVGLEEGLLDIPGIELLGEELALDDVGLGAVKGRRRRRLSARTRAKLRRLAKQRKRTATGRFAGLGAAKKRRRRGGRRRRKGGLAMADLGKVRRRRKAPWGAIARGRRIAKRMKRSKRTGRFIGLKGLEALGLSGLDQDTLMDMAALSAAEGLGAVKARRRRRRRVRGARVSGLGRLADAGSSIGQVEVAQSMPVVGVFQWLATGPGLEALGGVVLAPFISALVGKGLGLIFKPQAEGAGKMLVPLASGLLSAILAWEFGRLVGSANIAKFGAFYALGRTVEDLIMRPQVFPHIGLGDTLRIPDTAAIGYYGDIPRIPEGAELVGLNDARRIPDTAPIGGVLFPEIKRPDYAVNPLSGMGTVRQPDTAEIGQDEEVEGFGQEDELSQIISEEELTGYEASDLF